MILETEESATSSAADGEIVGIQFGLASHHEIRTSSISDCPISHASQLANPFLGLPLETGKCESCGTAEPGKCEGHFGYIELPIPVYHPSHISELKRMLSLICLKCLKMKTSKVPSKNNGVMERLLSACCEEASHVSIKEVKSTDGASFLELKIPGRARVHDAAWSFLGRFGYKYGDGSSRTLLASEVLAMLKKLREETKRKLAKKGYFAQDGYILTYLPVPPNCLSVPDVSDGVSVMSSDLCSSMLKKVLRQIDIIRSSRSGEPNFEAHEVEANDLQIAVSHYLDVRGTSKAARDGDKRFGVSKEASSSSTKAWLEKMRTLFISKGSGFSSRSVITGDAFRPVNEVGIPSEIAQKMTFEERVNVHNIQYLQRLVDNNLCLTFRDGSATYSLKEGSKGHTFLRIGQVVHRRIMDGDVVFINRPPTTHKHSLQALRVYIHDDHVVKINPLMCGPLAADFDGDCVHLFYPQSLSARAEVLELFSVDKQLLSSHSGNLNLQLATDALLSLKMIFSMYFMDKASAQQLVMHSSTSLPSPAVRKACSAGPRWSAQQILQTALPPQFECQGERLLIRGSEILKLDFNRDIIASVISDILTSLFFSKSPKQALNFFDSLQPLLMENIFSEGFSVSLSDFFVPFSELEGIQTQIQDMISPLLFQLRSSFNELIQLQFESYMKLLKVPISNFILKFSALGNLIDSRSESAIDKIVQQIGFLGLQLSDKRKFYSKSLVEEVGSLFKSKHPFACLYPSEECGLVRSCFFRGLDPYQEMVHSIATREVIVRSSKGLAEPGTLFKNLMAVLRDVVICYDGSVRNVSSNSVIQFEYGLEGVTSQSLFPAGEPVGVLAATAMSNPAYKAVLDSSPSSNSSWDLMKEILFCRANFRNDFNDRRVILYLNDCTCGRKYCQENASFVVKNHLKKVSLRDAAVEFLIEYKRPKAEPGSTDIESGLVGHIHLNATLLRESKISTHDILQKCEEQVNVLRRKKKYGQCFKRMSLSVSECCQFPTSGGRWTDMPCLKFFWEDMADPHIEKISHIMADLICPVLLDTVIKGDPRISTVNIVWINPGTTSWVQSPCERKGELGVEVTLEKTAVRQSGDAWRIVLDCCLPIFHLVDTRRSIPYAIKQIQDLLGISCGFDQAVQRLSTSVTLVTRGVLKEHLILLASSMTCSGNLVGFNISGIKALCRALSAQVPFTEATLYTPRKCFERASEKRHVDSLAGIVASCSWGKRVAVGTGTKFEILWDTKEIEMDKEPIDVYNFLHLVRSSNEEGMETGCLGEDIDEFDWEDSHMEPALSPDQENKAVFEEIIELDMHSQEQGGGSSESGWNVGSKSAEGNGWANWGPKKDPPQPEDRSGSASWDVPKNQDSAKGDGSASWGTKKDQSRPEDSSTTAGWGASKTQDSEEGEKNQAWGNTHNSVQEKAMWGQPQPEDRSGSASWDVPKSQDSAKGNDSVNWGTKKDQSRPEDSSKTAGWGASKTQDSEKEGEKNQAWGNTRNSVQEKATWGPPSTASWKQNKNDGDDNQLAGSLSLESESGRKIESSWGPVKEGSSLKETTPASSDDWRSKKSVRTSSDDWGSKKSVGTSSNGWNSQQTKSSWNSGRNDGGEKSSLETPSVVPWSKNNSQGGGGWASTQANQHVETGAGWGASKTQNSENEGEKDQAWGNSRNSVQEKAMWGPPSAASWKQNKNNGDDKQLAGSLSLESESGRKIESSWGPLKEGPSLKETTPVSSDDWGSKKSVGKSSDEWGSKKSVGTSSDDWGSKKSVGTSSNGWNSQETKSSWNSGRNDGGEKSSLETPSGSPWSKNNSQGGGGGWASTQANQQGETGGWGSEKKGSNTQFSWKHNHEEPQSQSGRSFGRGSGRGDNGGGRGWGSNNSGEWKSRKNRLPKQPGSNDDFSNVALTATKRRMDLFPAEEQDALSEIEKIMLAIRRIMHQSGCNDGDPLPSDDQSYIINNVLEYHPDKAAKMGAGIDFITVKKHSNFQESRCFFVVSTDGQSEDFSYIKCLENFIKGKHPSVAESFNSKYFRKPQAGGNRQPGQRTQNASDSPNFTQSSPESPNFTQNSPESPNFTQNVPESPKLTQNASEH
ncbi:DNA-directed RNA polymerase V subunit 1 [Silene latifolia]|uniref:DNA-directed RNA polymerase V subunit 1 n=1 Tax=Silene latifolia TaxID=37657 RepID=UPI003D78A297